MCIKILRKKSKYETAMNLIYDQNIYTLRSKVKILIVDDNEFELVDILKERKYDIYYKKDISYAIEAEPFDIIVIDIKGVAKSLGSGMEGFAIAKEIKTKYPAKQVWCYSASVIRQEISEKLCEIDGYISKDTDLDRWIEKLDAIIRKYCSKEYQEEVLIAQLKKYNINEEDSSQIIKEYRKAVENKNFNSLTEVMTTLIKSGKCIIEVMKTVYSYAELFAA